MAKLFICILTYISFTLSNAWACGCVGVPTAQLSEILETHDLVYATPISTQWLGTHNGPPLKTEHLDNSNHAKTTLIDVYIVGAAKVPSLSFDHPAAGNSCEMRPGIGYMSWYLLRKQRSGAYVSDYCTNRMLPYGAILEYHHTGKDALVTGYLKCPRYNRKTSSEDSLKLTKKYPKCDFWLKNYSTAFKKLSDSYVRKDFKRAPLNEQP